MLRYASFCDLIFLLVFDRFYFRMIYDIVPKWTRITDVVLYNHFTFAFFFFMIIIIIWKYLICTY